MAAQGEADGTAVPGPVEGLKRLVVEHPAALLSGAYLAVTIIGMLSSFTLFQRFGVNIFQFSQTSDFLIAAVRYPIASFSILLAAPFTWLVLWSDQWFWDRSKLYRVVSLGGRFRKFSHHPVAQLLFFVLYAWVAAGVSARRNASAVRDGRGTAVTVELQSAAADGIRDAGAFSAHLLGATSAYVFLYDVEGREVSAIPLENLARLTFSP